MTDKVFDRNQAHIYNGQYGEPKEPSPKYCATAIPNGGRSVGFHQCSFKPKIYRMVQGVRGGPSKSYGFCSIHDPVVVLRKRADNAAKWKRESEERRASWDRQNAIKAATDACVEAIKKIAAGHNDARGLAVETLSKFPPEQGR